MPATAGSEPPVRSTVPRDVELRRAYDEIADAYAARKRPSLRSWLGLLADRLLAEAPHDRPLLDLGCGPGVEAERLAGPGRPAVGLDLSAGMLAHARRRLPGRVLQADCRALPLRDASVGAVWSAYALLHVPAADLPAVIAEVARVLVPGGVAALTVATGDGERTEEVPYATGVWRTFVHVPLTAAVAAARSAGLVVRAARSEPESHRDAGWLLAVRP